MIFDATKFIPHRPPMLLIGEVLQIDEHGASALVHINSNSSFFIRGKGVPSVIGFEMMGQTAALIGGCQQQKSQIEYLGFLIAVRNFEANCQWFKQGTSLCVKSRQTAVVGDALATFDCVIEDDQQTILASAILSVMRQKVEVGNE